MSAGNGAVEVRGVGSFEGGDAILVIPASVLSVLSGQRVGSQLESVPAPVDEPVEQGADVAAEPEVTVEATVPEPATVQSFRERLADAQDRREVVAAEQAASASAAEADALRGTVGIFERVLRRITTAERNALGMGTPVGELPLDDDTRKELEQFFVAMDGGSHEIWSFDTIPELEQREELTPPVAPPALNVEGLKRGPKAQAEEAHRLAVAKYERDKLAYDAEVARRAAEPKPDPVETGRVTGWSLGYVTTEELQVTPGEQQVWSSTMGETPYRVVLGTDRVIYCIPTAVSASGNLVENTRDTRPRGLPLDGQAMPVAPRLGEFGRVQESIISYAGKRYKVNYAVFNGSGQTLGERLFDIALKHARKQEQAPVEETPAEPAAVVEE